MSWNDERIALLAKLWAEGLSASQIASRLKGVSRNGVLGKVHRLGLPGQAKTSRMKSHRPRKMRTTAPKTQTAQQTMLKPPLAGWRAFAAQKRLGSSQEPKLDGPLPIVEELDIPLKERRKLVDLTDKDCKWPIGDPQHDDFHFCNRDRVHGITYCEHHARRAYQVPPPPKPRIPPAFKHETPVPAKQEREDVA